MKLALIRRHFSATGGAELYLQRLLRALSSAGHELHLYAEKWDEPLDAITFHSVPVRAGRAKRANVFAREVQKQLAATQYDCVFSLERTISQDVYRAGDGVHAAWLDARAQYSGPWKRLWLNASPFHRKMRALERETFNAKNTRRVIVNSDMVRRELLERFNFPEERIHLVRNGIDVQRFRNRHSKANARQRLGLSESETIFLFVGSGWERKGLQFAINAVEAWSRSSGAPATLLVVGKGERGKFPNSSNAQVAFASELRDVEVAYAAADLFLFLPIYEPSANVCFEAMAAGLPVVTTRSNGASEVLLEGRTGSVVDRPENTAAVVGAINYWREHDFRVEPIDFNQISLERNVAETMNVLQIAAQERAASR